MQIFNFVVLFVITPSFFITNRFISNWPLNSKFLNNFQGSKQKQQQQQQQKLQIKEKWSFFFIISVKLAVKPTMHQISTVSKAFLGEN